MQQGRESVSPRLFSRLGANAQEQHPRPLAPKRSIVTNKGRNYHWNRTHNPGVTTRTEFSPWMRMPHKVEPG
ncbi:hypothetical protein J4Q44_G00227260 [Coregonus suidteri]|uniref:Uncharacterized protein n=1 Tax=Coregonus suidteri TaxID=861788 RepID=A0AAN8QR22_9TELE